MGKAVLLGRLFLFRAVGAFAELAEIDDVAQGSCPLLLLAEGIQRNDGSAGLFAIGRLGGGIVCGFDRCHEGGDVFVLDDFHTGIGGDVEFEFEIDRGVIEAADGIEGDDQLFRRVGEGQGRSRSRYR